MRLSEATTAQLQATPRSSMQGTQGASPTKADSWDAIATRVSKLAEGGMQSSSTNPNRHIEQLSGLLRLQVDVSRYQLRVELVSKVSESAVASVRKLQQNQ
jgi:hypothetical protein